MKLHSQAGLTLTDSFLINEIASLLAFHFSFPSSCLGTQILPQVLRGDIFVSPTTY